MGAPRRRTRLVPEGCIEHFEIRVVRYFSEDGRCWTSLEISTPEEPRAFPDLVEVHGALYIAHELADAREEA